MKIRIHIETAEQACVGNLPNHFAGTPPADRPPAHRHAFESPSRPKNAFLHGCLCAQLLDSRFRECELIFSSHGVRT